MTARDRIVVLVVAAAALVAGFWFLVLAPKREDASALDAKVAAAQTRLDAATASAAAAQAAKARYQRDYATVARLGKAVPVDDDVPSLVYQLESAAHEHHVDFRKIELRDKAGGTPAPAASSSSSSSAPSGSSTAASASVAAATLPPGASVGPAGFPTMPFSFNFEGSFFRIEDFLRELDGLTSVRSDDSIAVKGRLLSVDGLALTASRKGFPEVKASLAATAYLLPAAEGLTGGATSTAPSTGATTTNTSAAETLRSDR